MIVFVLILMTFVGWFRCVVLVSYSSISSFFPPPLSPQKKMFQPHNTPQGLIKLLHTSPSPSASMPPQTYVKELTRNLRSWLQGLLPTSHPSDTLFMLEKFGGKEEVKGMIEIMRQKQREETFDKYLSSVVDKDAFLQRSSGRGVGGGDGEGATVDVEAGNDEYDEGISNVVSGGRRAQLENILNENGGESNDQSKGSQESEQIEPRTQESGMGEAEGEAEAEAEAEAEDEAEAELRDESSDEEQLPDEINDVANIEQSEGEAEGD